jgi:hypothetical protein
MKLISLWEPWATLVAIGAKRVETRDWRTQYRGFLAIHASKAGLATCDLDRCLQAPIFRGALAGESLSPGCIVAIVRLVDCCPVDDRGCLLGVFRQYPELDTPREREFGNFGTGRWAWVMEDLIRIPRPIPFRSKQGLVDVPPDVITELASEIAGQVGSTEPGGAA